MPRPTWGQKYSLDGAIRIYCEIKGIQLVSWEHSGTILNISVLIYLPSPRFKEGYWTIDAGIEDSKDLTDPEVLDDRLYDAIVEKIDKFIEEHES